MPVDSDDADHGGGLIHGPATGDDVVSFSLPATVEAPMLARHYLDEHGRALPSDTLADALVLVSELVTNAVRHGRPAISLSIRLQPPSIGVAVRDHGDPLPRIPTSPPSADQPHGRGLLIVSALASAWGVDDAEDGPGKTVWFELQVEGAH